MAIWDWFRSPEKRATNYLNGDTYRPFVGRTAADKFVDAKSSMQITAVYACVRILAESVAQLPLQVYEIKDDETLKKAPEHKLFNLLHNEPNAEMTSFNFREALMSHLLLWGNAYAQILRNGRGEVVGLYPLMPDRMQVDRDENKHLIYKYTYGSGDATSKESKVEVLKPEDVLHIPGLGFDGIIGYSPIAMSKNAIGMGMACDEYGAKFFANGASPSGVLEHPGTLKDPERIRNSWNKTFRGSRKSHKVAVLEEGMSYKPISINPQDAQFLETRKFQIDEIARIFRVPPHMIGDLERSTFNNIEQQSIEFVKYTLDPWICRWEQALCRALLKDNEKAKYTIKFNVDGLLRGDYASRMQGYAVAIQNGIMSPNDARALENMNPIPDEQGGNKYMVNGTMTPLKDAGAAYKEGGRDEE